MANRETAVANSYESTLSASLDAGGTTINVASTDGTPGVPFYLVIEPGEDASREVVLVDQGKTGSTLTLSSSANRGQDGTSDVDHSSSAVIGAYPIAALWTDINDRVDEHSHSGGSDGAQVDHGDLGGLGGDDHPQYLDDTRHANTDHDALAIDHGSLSGRGDDDHPQYALADGTRTSEVRSRATNAEGVALSGSEGSLLSVDLVIPEAWSGWDVEWNFTFGWNSNSAAANRTLISRVRHGAVGGTLLSLEPSTTVTNTPSSGVLSIVGGAKGLTDTGTRQIRLTGQLGSNDDYDARELIGFCRATRTS